jgi:hypothetical protein
MREDDLRSERVDLLTFGPGVWSHIVDGVVRVRLGKARNDDQADWREAPQTAPRTTRRVGFQSHALGDRYLANGNADFRYVFNAAVDFRTTRPS